MAADYGRVTGAAMDPLAAAPGAAKAAMVGPGVFRALDENARLPRPLVVREFQVWELKGRAARNGEARREWRPVVRLGSNVSGINSQLFTDLDAAPPCVRKAGLSQVATVLRSPGLVGRPTSVAADAQLRFSMAAHQSADVLFDRREGGGRILARIAGSRARARKGSEQGGMTQRAKVGYEPCRTRPAHFAAPSCY